MDIDGTLIYKNSMLINNKFNDDYLNFVDNLVTSEIRPQIIDKFEENAEFPIDIVSLTIFLTPNFKTDIKMELKDR